MPKISETNIQRKLRRRWLPLSFIAVFAIIGAYLLIISHAATPLEPSVAWTTKTSNELVNINSNLCLGLSQTTEAGSGTKLLLENCSAQKNQEWALTWGSGTIKNTTVTNGFGQCLDDTAGSSNAGNAIQVYACNGEAASQTWSTGYGDGTIRIHGLCLGVNGNAKTAGSAIVLSACNLPTPSVKITSPGSGATISGTGATIAAAASVSSGSVQSVTITLNGTTIVACSGSSCSHAWNTTTVGNGTYTLAATAVASGISAQTTESVVINNPTSSSGSSSPSSGSSGQGSSSPATDDANDFTDGSGSAFGGVSSSGGSDTIGSSDLTGSGTTGSATTISSGSDTGDGSNTGSQSSSGAMKSGSSNKTSFKTVAAAFGTLVLVVGAIFLVFFIMRRRQLAGTMSGNPATPQVEIQNLPTYPQEDSGTSAARLNWWLPEGERQRLASQQQQPTMQPSAPTAPPNANEPPDMFAEGRKRLEEEEQRRQTKGY